MRARLFAALGIACLLFALAGWQDGGEELETYSVRWVHGGKTDFGSLKITTTSLIFIGDNGETRLLPYLHLDSVKINDGRWIQARSNRETGASFGLNDVYNFGVVGADPDQAIIDKVNNLIMEAKRDRLENAEKLEGEQARYMVSKAERIGDDVGLLIITKDKLLYRSDTGGKSHTWGYNSITGIEILEPDLLKIHTKERSVVKLGAHRGYRFYSQTGSFKPEDLAFIITRIAEVLQAGN